MPNTGTTTALFHLGQLVATPGALEMLKENSTNPGELIARHVKGDWGVVCADDKALNDAALVSGDRLLSAYYLPDGAKIWVITEWDRSVTTLLLPEEY